MTFDECIGYVIEHEGGLGNDANDSGGETNYGISKKAFPGVDIAKLTKKKAIELYKTHYWDMYRIGEMPGRLRLIIFDATVNQGPNWTVKSLQNLLGVKPDGLVGEKTLQAMKQMDKQRLFNYFMKLRLERYFSHPKFKLYGKGWMNRLTLVVSDSLFLSV